MSLVAERVERYARVAVTVLPGADGRTTDAEDVQDRVSSRLPGAHVLPLEFGPAMTADPPLLTQLADWKQRHP